MLGIQAHLATFSFINVPKLHDGIVLSDTLVGLTANDPELPYSPESFLTHWFKCERNEDVPIWCIHKTGAQPLIENYERLIAHLNIDGILLIDGGHDALMHGDEAEVSNFIEEALSLFAISQLSQVSVKLLSCIGLGAEEKGALGHVFKNISRLTQLGAFYGACALTPQMFSYQAFEDALLSSHAHPLQDQSVVNTSILSAVHGRYGNFHLTKKTAGTQLWISPLMPIYWFFDAEKVAEDHLLLPALSHTFSFGEAVNAFHHSREVILGREEEVIPIL